MQVPHPPLLLDELPEELELLEEVELLLEELELLGGVTQSEVHNWPLYPPG